MKLKRIFFIVCFGALASCSKPDMRVTPPPGTAAVNTIADYLSNEFELSLFASLAGKTDFSDSLKTNVYTVFAITNTGFNQLGIYTAADFDKWGTDSLNSFIRQHTLQGKLFSDSIPRSLDTRLKTINDQRLLISYYPDIYLGNGQDPNKFGEFFVNGVKLLPVPRLNPSAQIPKSYGVPLLNGVVYPVTMALKTSPSTVQEFLASKKELSIFTAGLKKFGQWDRLATQQQITVFAPPDSVFLRYGIDADSITRMDAGRVKRLFMDAYILGYNRVFGSDIRGFINATGYAVAYSNPRVLLYPTSETDIVFVMLNGFQNYQGCFLADMSVPRSMNAHPGGTIWEHQILGSNANSDPVYEDWNTGYNIPYAGELRYFGYVATPGGAFMNYNCANGVVHFINGLLLMPDEAAKN